jgi:hypothetical protein
MYLLANAMPHVSASMLRSQYDVTAAVLLGALRDHGHAESWFIADSALRCLGALLQSVPATAEEWGPDKVCQGVATAV